MNNIKLQQIAENILKNKDYSDITYKNLDDLYGKSQNIVSEVILEIENTLSDEIKSISECLGDGEEWYDDFRDDWIIDVMKYIAKDDLINLDW